MAVIKHSENCSDCHECIVCTRHGRLLKVCDICYRAQVVARLAARKIKRILHEGCLILYYVDGWRVGYLVKLGVSAASVQPIGGLCGSIPENIRVPLTDIKPEIVTSAKCPQTVQEYYEMNEKKKVLLVADQTSSAVSKAVEYLMNRPVEHTFGAAPVLKSEDAPVPVEPEGKFIHTGTAEEFAAKIKERVQDSVVFTEHEQPKEVNKKKAAKIKVSPAVLGDTIPVVMGEAKPRLKHAAVDLTEARRLYETGSSINDVVAAVKGTRAEFDVKKLIRKTFKELGILKD